MKLKLNNLKFRKSMFDRLESELDYDFYEVCETASLINQCTGYIEEKIQLVNDGIVTVVGQRYTKTFIYDIIE